VALSGGPDSVCLLFLLQRLASSSLRVGSPPRISTIAFTVDHQLQSDSAGVALSAARHARSLNIPHYISTIKWGEPPFPHKPTSDAKVESVARKIRYHLLLDAMKRERLQIMCTGHHYDDQIETALMRLHKRSARSGLAGMRDVRRWGMGDRKSYFDGLGWAGSFGMQCWIARPLLGIRKVKCSLESAL
jgi:tRNA(Ile)-lysidine synthase